jgi:hypothetical protein
MKHSKAINRWSIDYLNRYLHNFNLNVVRHADDLHPITGEKVKTMKIENMPFSQFVEHKTEPIYVNNNHTILSHFPQLFEDIKPEYQQFIQTLTSTNLKNIHIANLFIGYDQRGGDPSGSSLHCGGSGNFFCMIKGTKTWTLIPPEYSCLLKGRVAPSGIHAQTLFEMTDRKLTQYPTIYRHLPRYEVTLEPGDVLWNAPWWWHRIQNGPGESIGMAIRNNKVTMLNLYNNFTYTCSGYVYLLYNSVLINLYERLIGNQNFKVSEREDSKDDVLYQINELSKRYPTSLDISITR